MQNSQEHEIVLYQIDDNNVCVSVIFKDETFWLSQNGMAELFGVNIPDISKHLSNIYSEGELEKNPTVSKMEIVQNEGGRFVRRKKDYYNLDAIIAVGYRVNSKKATRFRQLSMHLCRISFIMLSLERQLQKSFMTVQMQKSQRWT